MQPFRVNDIGAVFYEGPDWRNPDHIVHVTADQINGDYYGFVVGFEDLWGGGDYDYNDVLISAWPVRPQ